MINHQRLATGLDFWPLHLTDIYLLHMGTLKSLLCVASAFDFLSYRKSLDITK